MELIDAVLIQNFQNHTKRKVSFDQRITTIIGPSDVGKSAIIRAVRWVALNQPQGDGFVKHGEKGTTVQLHVDDSKVIRKRGKGVNLYLLGEDEFKAFGANVPDTVASLLQLSDINFQMQHDPPFWISLSSGEVSRRINDLVDLGVIDRANKNLSSAIRKHNQAIEIMEERVDETIAQCKKLDWVKEASEEYQAVESLDLTKQQIAGSKAELQKVLSSVDQTAKHLQNTKDQRSDLIQVGKLGTQTLKLQEQINELQSLLDQIKNQQELVEVELPSMVEVDAALKAIQDSNLKSREEVLDELLDTIDATIEKIKKKKKRLAAVEKELAGFDIQFCETCGQPI